MNLGHTWKGRGRNQAIPLTRQNANRINDIRFTADSRIGVNVRRTSGPIVKRPCIKTKPKYVQQFTDRHGVVRTYFRKKGYPITPLPSVGTPRFDDSYQAAFAEAGLPATLPWTGRAPIAKSPFERDRLHAPGYVYFLRRAGAIKIGWSTNPFARADDLKTGSREKVESIVALRGTRRHEKLFHRQFERHRRNGEWFTSAPDLVKFVARSVTLGRFEFELIQRRLE